jgi:hypothetical protein
MPNPIKPPGPPKPSLTPSQPKDLGKVGKQGVSVKTPKMKKPGDAFAPPSVFFKSESNEPKHPNLKNLWDFMNRKHKS